jgi:hypothetical protein
MKFLELEVNHTTELRALEKECHTSEMALLEGTLKHERASRQMSEHIRYLMVKQGTMSVRGVLEVVEAEERLLLHPDELYISRAQLWNKLASKHTDLRQELRNSIGPHASIGPFIAAIYHKLREDVHTNKTAAMYEASSDAVFITDAALTTPQCLAMKSICKAFQFPYKMSLRK